MKQIPLTKGAFAIVDDDVYSDTNQYKWCITSAGYAIRNVKIDGKNRQILMHRQITNAPKGTVVDHINGNSLDNRMENLRVCTHRENLRNQKQRADNSSGYKGVYFDKKDELWVTRITVDYHMKYIDRFDNPHDAARMYNFWAIDLFGEYARLNVVNEGETK